VNFCSFDTGVDAATAVFTLLYGDCGCSLSACSTFIGIVDLGAVYTVPVASDGIEKCPSGGDVDCDSGGGGGEAEDSKNVRRLNFELSATSSCAGRNDMHTPLY